MKFILDKHMNHFLFDKRFLITGLLVLFSLAFLLFLPANEAVNSLFQGMVVSIAFFLVIPFFYCKMVLKEPLKNMGWQEGSGAWGILVAVFCILIALSIIFLLSRYTQLQEKYFFPVSIQTNFVWFMLYEIVLVSFTALLYEVFFRGFIQMLWLKNSGYLAILLQVFLFLGFFFLNGDLNWQKLPLILFSPFAGIIAYTSRSLWYSWAASWIFFFLTDVFLLIQK